MQTFDFTLFPELSNERLLLRKVTTDDVEALFEIRSNQEAMKYIDRPIATNRDEIFKLINVFEETYEKQDGIIWAVTIQGQNKLIGTIGYWRRDKPNFRAEIGYILNPEFHRKGIMSEAMKLVIDFGFQQLNLHSIEANINPANDASRKILLKNGFVQEAYFRENYFAQGKFLDSAIFSLLNNQ